MTISPFKYSLVLSRVVVGFALFVAFMSTCELIGLTWDAATGGTEVILRLRAPVPNLFKALNEAKAGWKDGASQQRQRHRSTSIPLPTMQPNRAGFELTADPETPVLRYNEPSPWKRVVLLHLGASDKSFSLSWILFLCVGSWLLWKLLFDISPSMPFTQANARRLGMLGLLVMGLVMAQYASYAAVRALLPEFYGLDLAEPLSHYVRLNTEDSLPDFTVGVMLSVIAAVYQRGVELSQEAELVI
ncbi:MAG TPA: DUF2975 domain-containing protein [Hymenobacter sp.]|jgi:hypothetical protein